MPLDPDVQAFVDQINALGQPPIASQPVELQRAAIEALGSFGERPEGVETEDRTIPGPAGPITVRVYRSSGALPGLPVLVYLHGGGFVIGSLSTHDAPCADFSLAADCVVLSVDYRLAPEHPFPAAVEDAEAALEWAMEHAAEIGGDPARVAIGGDSAGGNLAAVVARRARDAGVALQGQLLVYPWLDLASRAPSLTRNAEGYLLETDQLLHWRGHYVGEDRWADPDVSPAVADDLTGTAPAVVVTAEFDPLVDDGDAYAGRLAEAGVPVTHVRFDGLVHAFLHLTGASDACRAAVDRIGLELRKLLHG
jgi:acetyl esterase